MNRAHKLRVSLGRALGVSMGVAAMLAASVLHGQQPDLQFEVASIRPTVFPNDAFAAGFRAGAAKNPCGGGKLSISGTLVNINTASICSIIRIAYEVMDYQVIGMPAGLDLSDTSKVLPFNAAIALESKQPPDFFDIVARSPGSTAPTEEQVRVMLRSLLRDRFHLALHRENRELPFYALVVAKGGPKLTTAVENCKPTGIPTSEVIRVCGRTMEQIARYLNSYTDRRVVDMTGITGTFDYEVPIDLGSGSVGESILAGIQERLSLRLEPRKGPSEVLVVDRIERPSEN
jgi:uncharacterized protein (TIGR03435 family)